MSTISASNQGSFSTVSEPKSGSPARTIEADPGPWLAITGPFLIALTVIAAAWFSISSF